MKFNGIGYLIWVVLLSLIAWASIDGVIHFGYGLGDLYYVIMVIAALIVSAIIKIILAKRSDDQSTHHIFLAACLIFLIFIILKFTLLRGIESPWDGRIFMY